MFLNREPQTPKLGEGKRKRKTEILFSFDKPIVKFPSECFIADNQQILISKMKRNTYSRECVFYVYIWRFGFGYSMDEFRLLQSQRHQNTNKISFEIVVRRKLERKKENKLCRNPKPIHFKQQFSKLNRSKPN